MTNKERQAAYKGRQRALGRKPVTMLLTDDEQFYLERVLKQMREQGGYPAMMRNGKGQMVALDA